MDKRVALTVPVDGFTLAEHTDLTREAERLGYRDAWSWEADGLDAFSPLAVAGLATGLRLGTAIVNVYTRGPATIAQCAAGLADIAPGHDADRVEDQIAVELARFAEVGPTPELMEAVRAQAERAWLSALASGEERAWGRRLAKRFDIPTYDDRAFVATGDGSYPACLDHESLKPETIDPEVRAFFDGLDEERGDSLIAFGWAMAEFLAKFQA